MDGATLDGLMWTLLAAVVLPAWLLAGVCDYLVHARTHIERTSGVRESLLHLLQTTQIGLPMLAVLFLEVNCAVLALCVLGVLAHSFTAWIDLRYTQPLRRVGVFEQYVHAFLIVLPLMALALVLLLHWPGGERLTWSLQLRREPLPRGVLVVVLGACALFGVAPGVWELVRCLRHAGRGKIPRT